MSERSSTRRLLQSAGALFTLAVAIQLLAGCGDDKKNPASPPGGGGVQSSSFVGIFTNGTESGKISITINTTSLSGRFRVSRAGAGSVDASATLSPSGGGTVGLTGTYDDATNMLNLFDGTYTFDGEYDPTNDPPAIIGSYKGPNGDGQFGALPGTVSSSPIEIYLGTFESDSTNTHGAFNIARWDTLAGGLAFVEGDTEALPLDGMVSGSGTTRTISLEGGEAGFSVTADGTLDTSTHEMSGTWHSFDTGLARGDDGTWSGMLQP